MKVTVRDPDPDPDLDLRSKCVGSNSIVYEKKGLEELL